MPATARATDRLLCEVPLADAQRAPVRVRKDGRELLVVSTAEGVRVYNGVCPHLGGPLLDGRVDASVIVCPWHAYAFDAASGACRTVPGGPWRAGGCTGPNAEQRTPAPLTLERLRHEVSGGSIRIYTD